MISRNEPPGVTLSIPAFTRVEWPVVITIIAILVACEVVWALEWSLREFKKYAATIVPALSKAAEREDHVGKYARVALKRFQFDRETTQAFK